MCLYTYWYFIWNMEPKYSSTVEHIRATQTFRYQSLHKIKAHNKHMRRFSAPLILREMQIKTQWEIYFTSTRMAMIKKTDNSKNWWACGKDRNPFILLLGRKMLQLLWKTVNPIPQMVQELLSDPTIPLK